jgi:hypothetical protein
LAIATAKWGELEGFGGLVRLSEVDYLVLFFVLFGFGAGPLSLDALLWRRRADVTRDASLAGAAPA